MSIPFTWNLPSVRSALQQKSFFWDRAIVGGPAVKLITNFFEDMQHVIVGNSLPGVLQRINPLATRTTVGCVRRCAFCGVVNFEPEFKELADWPDLPEICDNNILAASTNHFDKVVNRLLKHSDVDFNQGLDARLLTNYHANRISEIKGLKKRGIRLALDNMKYYDTWLKAFDKLRSAGIAKRNISSYAIVGFDSDPDEAWARCEFIESHGVRALPMWYHRLDQLKANIVTKGQELLGWNDFKRREIMHWFWKHKKAVAYAG